MTAQDDIHDTDGAGHRFAAGHGPMAEAVLEQAHRRDASVIVLGSEGGARSPARVLGGMAAALVDRSDLPVLVVPPEVPPFAASEPILMCYDGSPPARRALTTAAGLLMGRAAIVVASMPAVDDVAILRSALPPPAAGAVQDGLARLHREEAEAPAERALEGARTAAAAGFLPRPAGIREIDASSDEASDPFKRLLRTAATEDAACIVVGAPPVRHASRQYGAGPRPSCGSPCARDTGSAVNPSTAEELLSRGMPIELRDGSRVRRRPSRTPTATCSCGASSA